MTPNAHSFRKTRRLAVPAALILLVASAALADVKLPSIIGPNMVLQADVPVPVWGTASAGETVTVTFAGQNKAATAGTDGKWRVTLDKLAAGGKPMTMTVKGNNTLSLENVLVGEVWLGSGQSNMFASVKDSKDGPAEVAAATHPTIRLFLVTLNYSFEPMGDVGGKWVVCTPETAGTFSAVAYYFGRSLQQELRRPVGLIAASWSGTLIEPWIPMAGLESAPELKPLADKIKSGVRPNQRNRAEWKGRNQWPTVLWNAMIQPLVPYAIRGVIWYQGESNVWQKDGMAYFVKSRAMLAAWRKAWGQGDFPFLLVQLAPTTLLGPAGNAVPGELGKVREAQTACLSLPNTGMAVTTDIVANLEDIHSSIKQEVGRRLALWALAGTYGRKDLVFSGPLYKSAAFSGGRATIDFDHVAGGLVSRDGRALTCFEIAGADGTFVPAQANIEGDTVVVRSDKVADPKAVRFGWGHVDVPNLENKAHLPASPFRTDGALWSVRQAK